MRIGALGLGLLVLGLLVLDRLGEKAVPFDTEGAGDSSQSADSKAPASDEISIPARPDVRQEAALPGEARLQQRVANEPTDEHASPRADSTAPRFSDLPQSQPSA